jgi:hypothetical protein
MLVSAALLAIPVHARFADHRPADARFAPIRPTQRMRMGPDLANVPWMRIWQKGLAAP